jgi:hypothetical protein
MFSKFWLMAVKVDLNEITLRCTIAHTEQRWGRLSGSRQSLREIFHLSFHSCSHYTRDIQGNTSTAVSSCHTDRCHTIILVYTSTIYSSTIQFGLGGVVGAALNEMGIMSSSWLSLSLCSWRACWKSPTSELAIMELVVYDDTYNLLFLLISLSLSLSLSVQRRQQQHHCVYTRISI